MSAGSPFPRTLAFSFAFIFALGCAATAAAQSGRRAPKSATAPVVTPTPEPTPAAVTASERPKPVLHFVVGLDRYDSFSSISLSTYNDVLRSCAQRLDEPPSVSVERVERSMSRGEASKRAKAEKNAYVVFLRVREDEMGNTPNSAYIEYAVFAPTTAKVVSSGSAYARRRGIIPSSRTPGMNGDREVIEAARTVANKILAAMHMHIPSRPISGF